MRKKRATMIQDPAAGAAEPPPEGEPSAPESLEQRVRRLEDAVAALQDTHLMEERIVERVAGKVNRKPEPHATAIMAAAERHTPAAADPAEPANPEAPAAEPAAAPAPARRPWLIAEVFREIRTFIRMFFDTRYRTSWSALFALLLVAYVLVSQWLWSLWAGIPVLGILAWPLNLGLVGTVLDKAVDLVLALFAYKVLSREVARYREAIAGRSPYDHY